MKTILFDLDGTLLPMDVDKFMYLYGKTLSEAFLHLEPSGKIFEHVMSSVKHTVMNTKKEKNFDKFFTHFQDLVEQDVSIYIEAFNAFYENGFEQVKASTDTSSEMIEAIKVLKNKGYQLMIATNPIFPMVANKERIKWAGLDINDFDYVSSFEENHHCKPHLEFYKEVLSFNDLDPENVLMVGNDAQEDLAIRHLGVKTYLIDNHLIHRDGHEIVTDYRGTYHDFLEFAKSLAPID